MEIRVDILEDISYEITELLKKKEPVQLLYICTHNSRRSQLSEFWADHFNPFPSDISVSSGGTEETEFAVQALKALKRAGHSYHITPHGDNPRYTFGSNKVFFSKTYQDAINGSRSVIAIMTCDEADEACPYIPEAAARFNLSYIDPKFSDETDEEIDAYNSCSALIEEECRQLMGLVEEKMLRVSL